LVGQDRNARLRLLWGFLGCGGDGHLPVDCATRSAEQ
jgi:hypothetical protein